MSSLLPTTNLNTPSTVIASSSSPTTSSSSSYDHGVDNNNNNPTANTTTNDEQPKERYGRIKVKPNTVKWFFESKKLFMDYPRRLEHILSKDEYTRIIESYNRHMKQNLSPIFILISVCIIVFVLVFAIPNFNKTALYILVSIASLIIVSVALYSIIKRGKSLGKLKQLDSYYNEIYSTKNMTFKTRKEVENQHRYYVLNIIYPVSEAQQLALTLHKKKKSKSSKKKEPKQPTKTISEEGGAHVPNISKNGDVGPTITTTNDSPHQSTQSMDDPLIHYPYLVIDVHNNDNRSKPSTSSSADQ